MNKQTNPPYLSLAGLLHRFKHSNTKFGWGITHYNARSLERLDLVRGSAFAACNDSTSMSHTTTWRRSNAGNKTNHRFLRSALLYKICSFFLS
jgi:hypothetical protein